LVSGGVSRVGPARHLLNGSQIARAGKGRTTRPGTEQNVMGIDRKNLIPAAVTLGWLAVLLTVFLGPA
jgi:hypothetical protein